MHSCNLHTYTYIHIAFEILTFGFGNAESKFLLSEAHIFSWEVAREVIIDAIAHCCNLGDHSVCSGLTIETAN